jgi:hypothetical protein
MFPTWRFLSASAAAVVLLSAEAVMAHHESQLMLEQPAFAASVRALCTGVGIDARERARMMDYSLRIETAAADGHYLGDQLVEISGDALAEPVRVHCKGPWVLADVPDGRYRVAVELTNHGGPRRTAWSHVSGAGQTRLVIHFPTMDEMRPSDRVAYAD